MPAQTIIISWVVLECKAMVIAWLLSTELCLMLFWCFVEVFRALSACGVHSVENEADLKLQNAIAVLATVHPQVWLHVALQFPWHVFEPFFDCFARLLMPVLPLLICNYSSHCFCSASTTTQVWCSARHYLDELNKADRMHQGAFLFPPHAPLHVPAKASAATRLALSFGHYFRASLPTSSILKLIFSLLYFDGVVKPIFAFLTGWTWS